MSLSKRVALSRDLYSAGVATITGGIAAFLFAPLNAPGAPTTAPPNAPSDARPALHCDRIFVSNPSAHAILVRPVIPGSTEAPEYPYPKVANAQGATGWNVDWIAFSPSALGAAPASNAVAITVPAGAVAFPIEVVCIGLVIGGTSSDTLAWAAYGSNKRA